MTTEVTAWNKTNDNIVTIYPKIPPASFFLPHPFRLTELPKGPLSPFQTIFRHWERVRSPPVSSSGQPRANARPRSFGLRKWSKKFETGWEKSARRGCGNSGALNWHLSVGTFLDCASGVLWCEMDQVEETSAVTDCAGSQSKDPFCVLVVPDNSAGSGDQSTPLSGGGGENTSFKYSISKKCPLLLFFLMMLLL